MIALRPRRRDRDGPPLGDGRDPTGVFFGEQTADAVVRGDRAASSAHADRFDPRPARRQAVLFRKERFEEELFGYLDRVMLGERREVRQAA